MYLAAVLKKEGFSVYLTEAKLKKVVKLFNGFNNSKIVVAYSIILYEIGYYLAFNKELKRIYPEIISVFGGSYPTFYPELIRKSGVDVICRREGEKAILDLVKNLDSYQSKKIDNIYAKNNEEIIRGDLAVLNDNLDDLPFPDRTLFKKTPILSYFSVMASRGCPFSCSFCVNHRYFEMGNEEPYVRHRSVSSVVKEIIPHRSKLKVIDFLDRSFLHSKEWIREFSKQYSEFIGIPFECNVVISQLDEENVMLLKKAGCFKVSFGIECFNDEYREKVLKKNITKRQIIESVKLLKKYNIQVNTSNMIGLPGLDLKANLDLIKFNSSLNPSYTKMTLFSPQRKTEIEKNINQFGDDINKYLGKNINFREKQQIMNLQRFSSFLVAHPSFTSLVLFLSRLPPNKFFDFFLYFSRIFGKYKIYGYILKRHKIKKINLFKAFVHHVKCILLIGDTWG
jgi:radical SAM superfamily enzyme YgiQ (UPF0313 family)